MTIRAKFRCLSITTKYDGIIIVNLSPVKRDGKDPENAEFWKYSPNGECELHFYQECFLGGPKDKEHDTDKREHFDGRPRFKVGAYYYIDMEKQPEVSPLFWELSRRDENTSYVNVELSWHIQRANYSVPPPVGMVSGRFKVGLSEDAVGAKEGFKPTRSLWTVDFMFAEESDQAA